MSAEREYKPFFPFAERERTVREEQDELANNVSRPGDFDHCGCCGQTVALYRRSLSRNDVYVLRLIAAGGGDFVNPREAFQAAGDTAGMRYNMGFTKAKYWGLIEPSVPGKMGAAGEWRIRGAGLDWLAGASYLQKYVVLYNDTALGFEGEHILATDI